jgi:hypothetical protein
VEVWIVQTPGAMIKPVAWLGRTAILRARGLFLGLCRVDAFPPKIADYLDLSSSKVMIAQFELHRAQLASVLWLSVAF